MKKVTYQTKAIRALRKIPTTKSKRIVAKINAYAADPTSQANNVKPLKGRDGFRLRVGDYRVIMTDENTVLDVLDIGTRGDIYKRKDRT